ncbi:hypothetical protein [Pseudoalteromonas sp. T1lg88]|uniref:hypothetical protein n=1 Tax=Pseudoalteromonas sp. T1lg88 TaxID=2077104 RepID=UPI000CF6314F|nr:hypothetical protein [Pseudoalteromonas sp. T1lg88]
MQAVGLFDMLHGSVRTIKIRFTSHPITLMYGCSHCRKSNYVFHLTITCSVTENATNDTTFKIQKVGQTPPHGERTPDKFLKVFGKERGLFLKGVQCENRGLGIGAFSYYRRVLEAKKNTLFDEIIKVLKLESSNIALINELEAAKKEGQFTKAVDTIKVALPDYLLINNHNPLKLMYSALSEGLHSHTDEKCLDLARTIKLILFTFLEKLEFALKSHDEVNEAVNRLLDAKKQNN